MQRERFLGSVARSWEKPVACSWEKLVVASGRIPAAGCGDEGEFETLLDLSI